MPTHSSPGFGLSRCPCETLVVAEKDLDIDEGRRKSILPLLRNWQCCVEKGADEYFLVGRRLFVRYRDRKEVDSSLGRVIEDAIWQLMFEGRIG
jgi:hypothetical protein